MLWRPREIRDFFRFRLWDKRPRYRGGDCRTIVVRDGERVTVEALARPIIVGKSDAMRRLEDLHAEMTNGEGSAHAGDG